MLETISVNVRGLNSDEKRVRLYTWINDIKADVIFLQETHYIEKNIFKYDSRWTGKSVHCFSDSPFSRGVSILFKKELNIEIIEKHRSLDGRRLLLKVKMHDKIFFLINIYAPNTINERCSFFKKLNIFFQKQSITEDDSIIMCGDFNCKLDNLKDQSNSKLKKVLSSFDLYDTWHSNHPQLNGYTWCNSEDIPSSRIDYIFINRNFTFDIKNIIIRKIPGTNLGKRMSDHRSIKITFNIDGNKRGNGYWKLNNSHLNDINYKTGIKKIISNLQNENLKMKNGKPLN